MVTLTDLYFNKIAPTAGDYCPTQEQAMNDELEDMTAEEMDAYQKKVVDFEERHGLINNPFWTLDPYWDDVWKAECC